MCTAHHTFITLADLNETFIFDIRYAKNTNFTGAVIYPRSGCYLREKAAHALDAVQRELAPLGLGLKIFDGYRPLRYQKIFWGLMPDERYVANPEKGSKHNRGAAVDLTLVRLSDGQELEMPSDFDDLTSRAHRSYETMTPEIAKNCKLLELVMEKHGFTGWPQEWWHFDFNGWEQYPIEDISFDDIESIKT